MCREIRRETYDVTLDMQGLARSGMMTFASRAKLKIGRFDGREGSRFFYGVKAPIPAGPPPYHAVEILRQFQRPLGLYDLDPEELSFPGSPVLEDGPPPGSILLFPESRRAEKEWKGFVELADGLGQAYPERTIGWLGTGKEPMAPGRKMPENVVDLRGKVPLASLPAIMREAASVVANDSGPMHLAAAMKRPVVAVFGPTDPKLYGPYPFENPGNVSIRGEGEDLSRVTVEEVKNSVSRLVSEPHLGG
ncbi:MAG: glycosyltransferase family 9 protein [Puniceicoccales bacterium]